MAGSKVSKAHVQITVDGQQAIAFYSQLQKRERELAASVKAGNKDAEKELNTVRGYITDVKNEMQDIADVVKGKVFANLHTLEGMAKKVKMQMKYAENIVELRKLQTQYKVLTDRIREMTNQTQQSSHAFGNLARRAAEYTGFYMLFNRSQQLIKNAIAGNLALSDSISDIQKVSGMSEEGVKSLVSQIEKLDSRNAPETLNNMAYAAGKLGIKGSENLLGFTRAADKLNVALKEYLGDGADGVVRLMKFANVMGTTDQYGVEQALLKTGSALNYMTQSTAAAADYMIDFAGRFGPIARQARMTSGDVIGLASALDALTVNNEEAATSLQKFVVKLLSSPVHVAKALGMDAQLSKQMVETGQSIELVEMALGKLGERAEKYGVSGIASVIGEIGSKGQAQRLIKTLATLSNNTEMVANYVTMANDAFDKGTSVIDEYNIKNQNAAAIMERAKNTWAKMLVNADQVDVVKELAQEFYDLSISLQNSSMWMGALKVAFVGVVKIVEGLLIILPGLLTGLATFGATKIISGIIGMARSLGVLYTSLIAGANGWRTFNLAMKSNAIGMAVSVIVSLVAVIWQIVEASQEAAKKTKEFNDKIKDLTTNMEDYNKELYQEQRAMDQLFAKAKAANDKTDEKKRLIAEINVKYGKYLDNLLTEKSTIDEIAAAQKEANTALREGIALKIKEGKLEEVRGAFAEQGATGLESFRAGVEKTGLSTTEIADAQQQVMDLLQKNYGKKGYTGPNQATVSILKELAKTDDRWSSVLSNRKDVGTIYDFMAAAKKRGMNYYGSSPIDESTRNAAYKAEQEMVAANKQAYQGIYEYVLSIIEMTNAEKKLNEKYDPLIGSLLNKKPEEDEGGGTTTTTETLEDFSAEQKAAEAEKKRLEAEAKKQMNEEYKGIKGLIEAFYNERAASINRLHEEGDIVTSMERDRWLEANNVLKAEAINNAWKYLLGDEGGLELWKAQYETMKGQIITDTDDLGEALKAAYENIGRGDMESLANLLKNFGSKLTGEMRNTIAKNDKLIAASGSKVWEEFEKTLDKHDYEETVRKKFWGVLQQVHLFRTRFEDEGNTGFDNITEASLAGIDELAKMYDKLFAIDIHSADGLKAFREELMKTSTLSHQMAEMSDEDMTRLYYITFRLGEEMTDANKKWVDFQKRLLEARYKRTETSAKDAQDIGIQEQVNKAVSGGMSKYGLESTPASQDAEIELYALKLEAATNYYEFLIQSNADATLLEQQRQKMMEATIALQDKMAQKMSVMQGWFKDAMNTLPEYGTALGEAFAKTNPEERAEAFQEAHKAIIKSLAETTNKMIIEWVKQRIQHALQQRLMAQDSKQSGQEQFEAETTAQTAISNAVAAIGQQTLMTKQQQNSNMLSSEAQETTGEVNLNIAKGAAKTIGELGWWGIPLVAVITALLNGLLSWAMGSLFKGKSSGNANMPRMKLVSGMLTYDEGNVDALLGGGTAKYKGTDGRTYSATPTPTPEGVAMVNHPIATMIGGHPSLVAEKGPELIIGRKTLRDMNQFRPDLLQQIAQFERRRFKTYDEGNVGDYGAYGTNGTNETNGTNGMATIAALAQVVAELSQTVSDLQRKGIPATINKYGAGGLVEEVADGLYATKKRNNNVNVRRLFGS